MNTSHEPPPAAPRSQRGFTLVELVVVLAITVVLAAGAAPSFRELLDAARMRTVTSDFVSALHVARSEAIKRRTRVALCRSSDGVTCAATGDWSQGWIMFHDIDNDTERDPHEDLVQRAHATPGGLRLAGNQPVARYISFTPTGTTRSSGGAFQAGTVSLCNVLSGDSREIVINNVGRLRVFKRRGGCL
jgi:type IV fimbrial biogenesis protein FimT